MSDTTCPAVLNIKGEHFPCDMHAHHNGLAHSSRDAEAIWHEDPNLLDAAWASAEAAVMSEWLGSDEVDTTMRTAITDAWHRGDDDVTAVVDALRALARGEGT